MRAERRAGELLRDTERAEGGRPKETRSIGEQVISPPSLSDLGVSRKQSMTWQLIAKVPEKEFNEVIEAVIAAGVSCRRN